jgi:hypothetical protein
MDLENRIKTLIDFYKIPWFIYTDKISDKEVSIWINKDMKRFRINYVHLDDYQTAFEFNKDNIQEIVKEIKEVKENYLFIDYKFIKKIEKGILYIMDNYIEVYKNLLLKYFLEHKNKELCFKKWLFGEHRIMVIRITDDKYIIELIGMYYKSVSNSDCNVIIKSDNLEKFIEMYNNIENDYMLVGELLYKREVGEIIRMLKNNY